MDVVNADTMSRKGLKVPEDANLTILLTKHEWDESFNAIKILQQFAQKQREKEDENRQSICQSIDTLFKHIFLKKNNKNEKEKEEKADIESEMKNISSKDFENMLNQIENDNDNKQQDNILKDEFCKNFDGFGSNKKYHVSSIPSSSLIVSDYEIIYQDFVSINNKLIDSELRGLLLKHSNNKQDVDLLYSKNIKRRNVCSVFPFKHCNRLWHKYGSEYISLINGLNGNKNDKLKMFCILYNCMASVFIAGDNSGGGLDKYIYDYKGTVDGLSTLCEWYILVQMVLTGIFGIDKRLTEVLTDRDRYGKDVSTSSVVSFIISNIFDNDLTSFKKLITYCIQDIKYNNNNIKKLKKMYKLNDEGKKSQGCYGISFYVLNRFVYVLYHDLLCMKTKSRNNQFLFPKLKKFYKFLYNFGVYCHCHTHCGVDGRKQEGIVLFITCFLFFVVFFNDSTQI